MIVVDLEMVQLLTACGVRVLLITMLYVMLGRMKTILYASDLLMLFLILQICNFWYEVKKIRNSKGKNSSVVDGFVEAADVSQLFAAKYRELYSSVPCDAHDMECIHDELESLISSDAVNEECIIRSQDVRVNLRCIKIMAAVVCRLIISFRQVMIC